MWQLRHFFLCQAVEELLATGIRLLHLRVVAAVEAELLPRAVGLLVAAAVEPHLLAAVAAGLLPPAVGLLVVEVELRLP